MTKLHISYRNAKGQMKSADPFNCPEDAPETVKIAAAAVVAAFTYGPPIPAPAASISVAASTEAQMMAAEGCMPQASGKGQGRRGRPKGFKCSAETRAQMAQSQKAYWRSIKAAAADADPERFAE